MKHFFIVLLLGGILLAVPWAKAENFAGALEELDGVLPLHAVVLMPSSGARNFGDDPAKYEGVAFPLYCGIVSIFPEENKFVFTKMTDLPILNVEDALRKVEKDGYIIVDWRFPVRIPARNIDFYTFLENKARSRNFKMYPISYAEKIPLDYKPRFTRMCVYSTTKEPPTDCAYNDWDIRDLYIPVTDDEMSQTIDSPAK